MAKYWCFCVPLLLGLTEDQAHISRYKDESPENVLSKRTWSLFTREDDLWQNDSYSSLYGAQLLILIQSSWKPAMPCSCPCKMKYSIPLWALKTHTNTACDVNALVVSKTQVKYLSIFLIVSVCLMRLSCNCAVSAGT